MCAKQKNNFEYRQKMHDYIYEMKRDFELASGVDNITRDLLSINYYNAIIEKMKQHEIDKIMRLFTIYMRKYNIFEPESIYTIKDVQQKEELYVPFIVYFNYVHAHLKY